MTKHRRVQRTMSTLWKNTSPDFQEVVELISPEYEFVMEHESYDLVFFQGKFRASPEFFIDMYQMYGIEPNDILDRVSNHAHQVPDDDFYHQLDVHCKFDDNDFLDKKRCIVTHRFEIVTSRPGHYFASRRDEKILGTYYLVAPCDESD